MLYFERVTSDKRNPSTSLRLLLVLRRVAVVVPRTNTTGFVSRKVLTAGACTFDDLAAAFGAFGVIFLINSSITTGISDIWIGARAEVQTSTIAEIISIPAQSKGGWLDVNSHHYLLVRVNIYQ